jgi:hypothetical protein
MMCLSEVIPAVPSSNVAATAAFEARFTLQAAIPVHAPDHPAKVFPASVVSVNTTVPWVKLAEQVPGQLIPAGELVTVPVPVPALVTVSWKDCGGGGGAGPTVMVTADVAVPAAPVAVAV